MQRQEILTTLVLANAFKEGDLGRVARALSNPLPGEGVTLGAAHHFGSRIQPNSPGDEEDEILFAILEGLTYGQRWRCRRSSGQCSACSNGAVRGSP